MHESAFNNIWFGDNPHGIYGAVPTDLMHAFLHGIVPYVIKTLLSSFTMKKKHFLDDLVDKTLVNVCSSERTKYPRCSFTRGISNLKLLTATEWADVAFAIALMMTMDVGYKLFHKVCKRMEKHRKKIVNSEEEDNLLNDDGSNIEDTVSIDNEEDSDEDDDNGENESIAEIDDDNDAEIDAQNQLYVLEMILGFHAWYKCRSPYLLGTEEGNNRIDEGICCMLSEIKKYIPHTESNGWKLQKFHDMLHISRDMQMFGCPQNWDASPGEHNLIDFAKCPARRTQKRHLCFMDQVAQRLNEMSCIQKAMMFIDPPTPACNAEPNNEEIESHVVGHQFATMFGVNGCQIVYHKRHNGTQCHLELHPLILNWFEKEVKDVESEFFEAPAIKIYSEYRRNRIHYWAHPNYQKTGSWHDWVMVMYENEDDLESDDDHTKNPFENNEKLMTVKKYMCWSNHVTIAIMNKIRFFFNVGRWNTLEEVTFSNPCYVVFQLICLDVPY